MRKSKKNKKVNTRIRIIRFILWTAFSFLAIILACVLSRIVIIHLFVPQFVLLTFDGSYNTDMWNETLTFANNNDIKFTYFINGVYFITEGEYGINDTNLFFGGDTNLSLRAEYVRRAQISGHDIGSHSTNHYEMKEYSKKKLMNDFKTMNKIVEDKINTDQTKIDLKGFRAPYTSWNGALFNVEKSYNMSFDSSLRLKDEIQVWPFKINDRIYEFPVLTNPIGNFNRIYDENRAPIVILNHFPPFDKENGNHWNITKDFAKVVCKKNNVRCTTISEALNWIKTHQILYNIANY